MLSKFRTHFTRTLELVDILSQDWTVTGSIYCNLYGYYIRVVYPSQINKIAQKFFEFGLLKYPKGDNANRFVYVAKRNKSFRICLNYCAFNMLTKIPAYLMKDVQKLVFTAGTA